MENRRKVKKVLVADLLKSLNFIGGTQGAGAGAAAYETTDRKVTPLGMMGLDMGLGAPKGPDTMLPDVA